ncbi:hypothetical protein M422DRAFT_33241 [Sphaerobolus stellatus SS14]|uniref:Unplaced genomic scaffold SPHSTscaffold_85, whole genome shotgun sequence n=1 Tax=Sphaerobolus stellatus (strain SS14) TaxID=990650 RepID=A0A0C9VLL2_SPHS4|nr:hypothetical protein M422DRAFT_33241 [Sphaerobolus stellatus SS14]
MKRLVAGLHRAVAIVDVFFEDHTDSLVIGWGASRHGQLGDISVPQNPAKGKRKAAFKIPEYISSPIIIRLPDGNSSTITGVSVGSTHTFYFYPLGCFLV